MRQWGVTLDERDLAKRPLTAEELDRLVGARDHLPFLNTRNERYRAEGFKAHPPERKRALALMAEEPNLLRRPLLILENGEILFGFEEERWKKALQR